MSKDSINITMNGEGVSMDSSKGSTLEDLVNTYQLERRKIAIEVNEVVVPKSEYSVLTISDGDRVEIVEFIGGG